uniref:Lipid body protein n=1 Tax=Lobosphaera incisa TaxID=312850 RepID=A0A1X9QDU2_9CHLO|nr:lipid body protein [Lobosphaera incisa]
MRAAASRHKLPPAEQVTEGPYELKPVRAPILTGWPLRVFIWMAETPLFAPIRSKLMRDSGMPQVLSDIDIPEHPTFYPYLPTTSFKVADSEQNIQDLNPSERADAASHAVPGFRVLRSGLDEPFHSRRWSIADFHQAYMSGDVTPDAVAADIIERIRESEAMKPPMRFLIAHNPQDLMRQAAESTSRYKAGKPLSVLDGVPYAVKDGVDALPYKTTNGTTWAAGLRTVSQDAPMVAALRATGAMLIGKANLHEIGLGTTGMNIRWGTARNPHDPAKFTGGSSSGSAAIVAAGLCPFAIGSDGGGSIRIPSSFCGCVGLKPTWGRDAAMGSPESWMTVAVLGPLAAHVEDAAIVYAATANMGQAQAQFPPAPAAIHKALFNPAQLGAASLPLRGRRIGVYWRWFEDADAEVVRLCKAALQHLEAAGAEVVSICFPELELLRVAHVATITCELAQHNGTGLHDPHLRCQFNSDVRLGLAIAKGFSGTDYLQAQQVRTRITVHLRRLFSEVDFIATPTIPITAPTFRHAAQSNGENDLERTVKIMRFMLAANFCGHPAISVPIGHSAADGNMPVGLQLMGRPWAESELLFAGSVLEAAVVKDQRLPRVSYDVLYHKPALTAAA